jgi:hypothetical protein
MSKKPYKTSPRAAFKTSSRKSAAGTKRSAPPFESGTAERIAHALEAIAAHLSAASPAAGGAASFRDADAFVWHPDGRLGRVAHVSRVDLRLL